MIKQAANYIRGAYAVIFLAVISVSLWQLFLLVQANEFQNLEQRVDSNIKRYSATLRNEVEKYQSLPQLLATNTDLETLLLDFDDPQKISNLNQYFEELIIITGASDIYLLDAEGTTVSASNWLRTNSFIGRNFSYRPYYTKAMSGLPGRYFALGTTSRKRGYYFSYPIYSSEGVIGVVVVKIDLNDIEEQWSDPVLDLLVTDDDGIVFISTRPDWKFHSIGHLTVDDKARIKASRRYPGQELQSLPFEYSTNINQNARLATLKRPSDSQHVEFLMMEHRMSDEGLNVIGLAKLDQVKASIRDQLVFATGALILILLLIAVFVQKRRLSLERTRFRQQATDALEANEARIQAILDNTQVGLITIDNQDTIETSNPTAETLLGYRQGELLGRAFTSLLDDRSHHQFDFDSNNSSKKSLETFAYTKEGARLSIEVTISKLDFSGESKRILTLHDIRERKKYETHLKQAKDELEVRVTDRTKELTLANKKLTVEINEHQRTQNELIQAEKLAVLGQLAAGINHELSQPLTAIRAYAENGKQFLQKGDLDTTQNNLKEIVHLTEHMGQIIAPLKVFSRKSQGEPEPVNLKLIQDGAMSILYARLEENAVEINWPLDLAEKVVIGDVVRLEQIVVNLLTNAMDAIETCAEKRIEISCHESDSELYLHFHDTGPGIPSDELHRVFEPFFTTKPLTQQGLGLGLSISQRIAESLGGKLCAENHPVNGAIFTLRLQKPS